MKFFSHTDTGQVGIDFQLSPKTDMVATTNVEHVFSLSDRRLVSYCRGYGDCHPRLRQRCLRRHAKGVSDLQR